jgi:hypothetical protein
MRFDIAAHGFVMFLDVSARRGNPGVLKNQAQLRYISEDC